MALTSLAAFKTHIGIAITNTTYDSALSQILGSVEQTVKNLLDRDILSAAYTEYYGGTNSKVLILDNWPVTTLTSIYEDNGGFYGDVSGSFAAATLLTSGTDYALPDGGLTGRVVRVGSVWLPRVEYRSGLLTGAVKTGLGNYKVTYTAGYISYGATAASITAGGSGYAAGDIVTLTGGTFTVATQLRVTTVSSGAITAAAVVVPGGYSAQPTNPVSQGSTTGSGSGATFGLTFANFAPLDLQLAMWEVGAVVYRSRTNGMPFQSESFEDYSYSLGSGDASKMLQAGSFQQILARYRRTRGRYKVLG